MIFATFSPLYSTKRANFPEQKQIREVYFSSFFFDANSGLIFNEVVHETEEGRIYDRKQKPEKLKKQK